MTSKQPTPPPKDSGRPVYPPPPKRYPEDFRIGVLEAGGWCRDWMNQKIENIAHGQASIIESYSKALESLGVKVKEVVSYHRPGYLELVTVHLNNGREYSGEGLIAALHAAWVDLAENGGIWKA